MSGNQLRDTSTTSAIIDERDKTQIKCINKPNCENLRNYFYLVEPWLSGIKSLTTYKTGAQYFVSQDEAT